MSQREDGDSNPKINGLSNSNHDREGHDLELDDTLTALIASTLLSPDVENFNDICQIAGEYSSLNSTIDELDRYLDRWEERHEQLRAHIREAIRANEEEEVGKTESLEENKNKESDSGYTEAVDESATRNNECETRPKDKQPETENDESI